MAHFCNAVEDDVLKSSLSIGTLTKSTSLEIDFHTGDPGEAGTANLATGYTTPAIAFAAPVAGAGTNRKIQNSGTLSITFSGGVTITWYTLKDPTSGKIWGRGAFSSSKVIPAAGQLDLAVNDVEFELSSDWVAFVQDGVLNAMRSNANFAPTAAKVTLSDDDPGVGVIANELAGITRQTPTWNTVASGATTNNGDITWPTIASQTAAWFATVRDSDGQVMWKEDIVDATDTDFRVADGVLAVSVD